MALLRARPLGDTHPMGHRVVIRGFRLNARERPAKVLERVLGLSPEIAKAQARSWPFVAAENVGAEHAQELFDTLAALGAIVEIEVSTPAPEDAVATERAELPPAVSDTPPTPPPPTATLVASPTATLLASPTATLAASPTATLVASSDPQRTPEAPQAVDALALVGPVHPRSARLAGPSSPAMRALPPFPEEQTSPRDEDLEFDPSVAIRRRAPAPSPVAPRVLESKPEREPRDRPDPKVRTQHKTAPEPSIATEKTQPNAKPADVRDTPEARWQAVLKEAEQTQRPVDLWLLSWPRDAATATQALLSLGMPPERVEHVLYETPTIVISGVDPRRASKILRFLADAQLDVEPRKSAKRGTGTHERPP